MAELQSKYGTSSLVTKRGFINTSLRLSASPASGSSRRKCTTKVHSQSEHRKTNGGLLLLCCWPCRDCDTGNAKNSECRVVLHCLHSPSAGKLEQEASKDRNQRTVVASRQRQCPHCGSNSRFHARMLNSTASPPALFPGFGAVRFFFCSRK